MKDLSLSVLIKRVLIKKEKCMLSSIRSHKRLPEITVVTIETLDTGQKDISDKEIR